MRKILVAIAATFTLLGLMATASFAQDFTLEIDPGSVDAAGEHELEVSLSGFSPEIALFVLPCEAPESGDIADLDDSTCDQGSLTPIKMDGDGAGTVSVTYDIPEEGIVVVAGDAARTEIGVNIVTVGDSAAADDDAADDSADADEAEEEAPAELAETGPGALGWMLLASGSLVLAGGAALFLSRRPRMA